jgi:4-amino-4-deoxy-L-arabinose transferase-like glycosyltransferase
MRADPAMPSERPGVARPAREGLDGYGLATLALGVAFLALTVAGALATGTSWDEAEHRRYGELVLDFWTSFGAERAATTDFMRFYGGLHGVAGAAAERLLPFLHWSSARHLAAVAFGLLAFVCCVRLARLLGGPRAGFVAGLLLAAMPRWTGDAMYNPIDVPAAGCYALALLAFVRILGAPGTAAWREWLLFGAASGLTLAVRTMGLLLLFQGALALAVWALCDLGRARAEARRVLLGFALSTLAAAVVACAFWPRLLVEPLAALSDSLAGTKSFPWDGTVLFRGQNVSALELPRSYLPVWLALTTPFATALGVLLGLGLALRGARPARAQALRIGLVAFAVLFPLVYAFATRATLYDGIRHFLFVLPPLAALAALGWVAAAERVGARLGRLQLAVPLALGLCVLEPVLWTARAHPFAYTYFNPLAGGFAAASHAYESEYWGLSLRRAAEWLSARRAASAEPAGPFVVGTNAPWHLVEPWLDEPAQYRRVGINKPADVVLVYHRFRPRIEATVTPLHAETIVAGQLPFWEVYPGRAGTAEDAGEREGASPR